MVKLKWLWHWKGKNGIEHMTANREEANKALRSKVGTTIWAERIPENGIKVIRGDKSR